MTRSMKSIAQRLLDAEMSIKGTLNNPQILTAVTPFGYDQTRMEAGLALFDEARLLTELQGKEYGEQYKATSTLEQTQAQADVAYRAALKIARVAFEGDDSARKALLLNGVRKKSMSGWLEQTRHFYNNLLRSPAFLAIMAAYNYPQAKLEAEAAMVEAVQTTHELQNKERGEAQAATKRRDAKLAEMDKWVAAYKKVAEVALAASPQAMEQLGWVVP
jgi:hypothetical protein